MYTLDYHYCHVEWNNDSNLVEAITFHARLYSYGERYLVPGLKDAAWQGYTIDLGSLFGHAIDRACFDKFPEAITEIYHSTPDNDRELRDEIASACSEHLTKLLEKEGFLNALTIPGFAADVMRHSETKKIGGPKKPRPKD
jgi:hypothetical protein